MLKGIVIILESFGIFLNKIIFFLLEKISFLKIENLYRRKNRNLFEYDLKIILITLNSSHHIGPCLCVSVAQHIQPELFSMQKMSHIGRKNNEFKQLNPPSFIKLLFCIINVEHTLMYFKFFHA